MNINFRRRSQEVEAMEFIYPVTLKFMGFCKDRISDIKKVNDSTKAQCTIRNIEGEGYTIINQKAYEGDFIVLSPNGHLTVMRPMQFNMVYERVTSLPLYDDVGVKIGEKTIKEEK